MLMTSDEQYLERLNSRCTIDPETGCWEWPEESRLSGGYGHMWYRGRTRRAHRLALSLRGVDIEGLNVIHSCDNPPCVNPAHLVPGLQRDNVADMLDKGRESRGQGRPQAKLTDDIVVEMTAAYAAGGVTYRDLGERYGVSHSSIYQVITGKGWKHVPR